MRAIVLTLALVAVAAPAAAAPGYMDEALAKKCHAMAGKEVGEGEGKVGQNRAIFNTWNDCMMGAPNARPH